MKTLIYFLLILTLIDNAYCQEGKQENILRIEKFKDSSTIIQNPIQSEFFPSVEEKKEKISLETSKPAFSRITLNKKVSESLELKGAWKLYEEGNFKEASLKFKSLLSSSNTEISLSSRLGLAYSLKNLSLIDEALENFEYLYSENYKEQEMAENIVDLLIIKEQFEKAEKYAIKHCIKPYLFFEHAKKLKSLNEKNLAKEKFLSLLSCSENDIKLRTGILYEVASLTDYDEMLGIVEREKKNYKDIEYLAKINQLEADLHRKKLSNIDISSPLVVELSEKILKIFPDDRGAKSNLAWHYYNVKNYEKSLKNFLELNKEYPQEEEYLLGIAYCYNALNKDHELIELIEKNKVSSERLNLLKADAYIRKADRHTLNKEYGQAFSTIHKLSKQEDKISKQKAASWYCKQGFSILASHVESSDKNSCYHREQFPQIEIAGFYRYKSGDEGFSKLKELNVPLSFYYPIREGQKLTLRIIEKYVSSGSSGENPYMGKYYNYLNGGTQINKPITSKWLLQPEIKYEIEGYPHFNLLIGTTPLNGTISPMPVFLFDINFKDFWFNIYQTSVEESILSIQGQRDPYSSAKWGRVLKTGVQAGLNFDLSNSYWFTISGEFDYIWGKNVWENYSLTGNMSIGKTIPLKENSQVDLGLFYVIKHFNRNSNFFTYGHGGYFSPQFFSMVGPTFRYSLKECCGIALDIKASFGYIYYRTDSTPHYPKFSDNEILFNSSAIQDIRGYYEGEKKSKFGGSFEAKARQNISKNMAIYGYGRGNLSGGYNEWSIGVGFTYYFIP
ncbi:MAG: cellulose synthase subunit BcsC-related outer membrane protein [Thermodesulfovibrio sp.]|nr:cellulose synthase subunit BcsC-related outer membrane protein [Thermodesulfovibrio sp.]MDW7997924.1 cellulose synthase subunit BcsC-related outer membrane protein [Thermodesulfovibrio sp.]